MSKIARELDKATGTCYSHVIPVPIVGYIRAKQSIVSCDKLRVAVIGDEVDFNCGHTGIITTGVNKTYIVGIKAAHIGSLVVGKNANLTATVVEGSKITSEI